MNYSDKKSSYYANVRHDLISLIDKKEQGLKILEIGAAYGETLFFLKEQGIAAEVVGVELYQDVENKDNYKPLDRFIFANIEESDFSEYDNYFDIILLPDVLEHLVEPRKVLSKVKKYLNNDGEVLVSMPNIRHYSAINKILFKGDFRYEESGIFDYTHARFYCRKNIKELLENSGFTVNYCESSVKNYKGKSGIKIMNQLTLGIFEEFFSVQYFFRVKK
ncbi:class I SAM-dependent methyltransferase [uncultured Flavobacterium sp.]|uniref:class I SAM-dependent methyltransferase n=1 Tax=uncultured Flavobacterium sp. TaxID=165435 RepID=UPI0025F12487|nr:class I SAM-dependent methyltransferase [uncultured Flavobacterium sp.]